MNATRLTLGLPIAAGVTGALFLLMRALIFTEPGQLPEAAEDLRFDINPEVTRTPPRDPLTPDEIDRVDPPPPTPVIPRESADLPQESLVTIVGPLPDFDTPRITSSNVSIDVSDRNAQPLVRIPPSYPPRLNERGIEGRCTMQFDVSPDGAPMNIRATACTHSGFERPSTRAIERWRYSPKIQDGVAVARYGVVTDIDFNLTD